MIKTIIVLADGTEISAGQNEKNAIQSTSVIEACNDGEDLTFGSVCAKKIDVQIITPQNTLSVRAGDRISVYEECGGNRRKKGVFVAEKPKKKGANTTSISAYDYVSLLDKDLAAWFNLLPQENFPYSAFNLARDVCSQCGVSLSNSSIPNGSFGINKTTFDKVTGRQIIRWIGEICGCFCVADENGGILYDWYKQNGTPIQASGNGVIYFRGSLSYEDYQTEAIDRVQIRKDAKSEGVVYPSGAESGNDYIIEANPFLSGHASAGTIAEALYRKLSSVRYTPCKVRIPSSFLFNVGDIVTIKDANGVEIVSYIMQKTRNAHTITLESSGNSVRGGAIDLYNNSYSANYGQQYNSKEEIADVQGKTEENSSNIVDLGKRQDTAESELVRIEGKVDANTRAIELITGWEGEGSESIAQLSLQVSENKSNIESLTKRQGETDTTIATIQQTADEDRAEISTKVSRNDVTAEFVITAINEETSAKIKADRLDIEGKELNIKVNATNIVGEVTFGQLPETVATDSDVASAKDAAIATAFADATQKADTAKSEAIVEASNDATNKADSARASAISTIDSRGYQNETGVTKIVGGMITADYINALGIIAKGLSVEDLAALNATIGKWSITENGIYSDNGEVGLNGNSNNPIRIYAGLEKRIPNGAIVGLTSSDFRQTRLSDGWYGYSGVDAETGEIASYQPSFVNGIPSNLISFSLNGMFDGYPFRPSPTPVVIRNAYITYNKTENEVEIEYFECSVPNLYEHYLTFDLFYGVSESEANFRVYKDGAVEMESFSAKSFNAEEMKCSSLDIAGTKVRRKTGEIISGSTSELFDFKVSVANRNLLIYEQSGRKVSKACKFQIGYKLNGDLRFMDVWIPVGTDFKSVFVSSKNGDILSAPYFVESGSNQITIEEITPEDRAPEYIDFESAVGVKTLKIGKNELTEEKLAQLLKLI